ELAADGGLVVRVHDKNGGSVSSPISRCGNGARNRLAPALARSDFEAAITSVGFEVHRNCNAQHEQNFAPKQNVRLVELAVPRSPRRGLVAGHSDAGHEV